MTIADDSKIGAEPSLNGQGPHPESNGSKTLTFQQLLDLLPIQPDEYVSVCRQPVGGEFTSSVVRSYGATIS